MTLIYVVRTKRKRSRDISSYGPIPTLERAERIAAHEKLKDEKLMVWIVSHHSDKQEVTEQDRMNEIVQEIFQKWGSDEVPKRTFRTVTR